MTGCNYLNISDRVADICHTLSATHWVTNSWGLAKLKYCHNLKILNKLSFLECNNYSNPNLTLFETDAKNDGVFAEIQQLEREKEGEEK